MADTSMNLLDTLRKVGADGDVDLLREGVRVLAEAIMSGLVFEEAGEHELKGVPDRWRLFKVAGG